MKFVAILLICLGVFIIFSNEIYVRVKYFTQSKEEKDLANKSIEKILNRKDKSKYKYKDDVIWLDEPKDCWVDIKWKRICGLDINNYRYSPIYYNKLDSLFELSIKSDRTNSDKILKDFNK